MHLPERLYNLVTESMSAPVPAVHQPVEQRLDPFPWALSVLACGIVSFTDVLCVTMAERIFEMPQVGAELLGVLNALVGPSNATLSSN
ncbi:MAG: hypothetical protein AAFU73_05415 [Planctomycetota bacterium]